MADKMLHRFLMIDILVKKIQDYARIMRKTVELLTLLTRKIKV